MAKQPSIPALAGHVVFLVQPDCMYAGCKHPTKAAKHRPVVIVPFNNQAILKYERKHPGKEPPDARFEPALFICPTCAPKIKVTDVLDDEHWMKLAHHTWEADDAHIVPTRAAAVLGFSNLDVQDPNMVHRPTQDEVFGLYEEERRGLNS